MLYDMRQVTIHEAKTHFSRLLADVERGDEIVVARGSSPIARLVPFGKPPGEVKRRTSFGMDGTSWTVPENFDDPLPDKILDLFE